MVFDKLKFWKHESAGEAPDPFSPTRHDDAMQLPDPLAQKSDPLAPAKDPLAEFTSAVPDQTNQSGMRPPGQYPAQATFPQGTTGIGQPPLGHPDVETVPEPRERDTELVLAKLDAIKAELDALHQRIRKIEQTTDKRRHW